MKVSQLLHIMPLFVSDRDSFSVRLANNETAYRGYVEILLGGVWGTISPFYSSYTYWHRKEATVVCRELGLP